MAVRDFETFFTANYSEFNASNQVAGIGGSIYFIIHMVTVFAMVICICVAALYLMSGSRDRKAEGKGWLMTLLPWGIVFFGTARIIQTVLDIANTFKF